MHAHTLHAYTFMLTLSCLHFHAYTFHAYTFHVHMCMYTLFMLTLSFAHFSWYTLSCAHFSCCMHEKCAWKCKHVKCAHALMVAIQHTNTGQAYADLKLFQNNLCLFVWATDHESCEKNKLLQDFCKMLLNKYFIIVWDFLFYFL